MTQTPPKQPDRLVISADDLDTSIPVQGAGGLGTPAPGLPPLGSASRASAAGSGSAGNARAGRWCPGGDQRRAGAIRRQLGCIRARRRRSWRRARNDCLRGPEESGPLFGDNRKRVADGLGDLGRDFRRGLRLRAPGVGRLHERLASEGVARRAREERSPVRSPDLPVATRLSGCFRVC